MCFFYLNFNATDQIRSITFNYIYMDKRTVMVKSHFIFLFSIVLFFSINAFSQEKGDTVYYESGDIYIGEMTNGMANGYGKMIWISGGEYEGEWKNNFQHGEGRMKWPTGEIYEGDWVMGVQEGFGKMSWMNGDYYEGKFKNGLLEGKGTMWYANGMIYKGKWKENAFVE